MRPAEMDAVLRDGASPTAHVTHAVMDGRPASVTESLRLLDGGGRAYPRMLLAISRAQRSVHMEAYAFALSGVGSRFIDALGRAASRGVKVHVLIDGWGSARDGHAVAAALREVGCEVRIYHRLPGLLVGHFGRNHRKILLVDDEVAFLGGIDIGDENVNEDARPGWADLDRRAGRGVDPGPPRALEIDHVRGGAHVPEEVAARSVGPHRGAAGRSDQSHDRRPETPPGWKVGRGRPYLSHLPTLVAKAASFSLSFSM
jgi:hypothetical protein